MDVDLRFMESQIVTYGKSFMCIDLRDGLTEEMVIQKVKSLTLKFWITFYSDVLGAIDMAIWWWIFV
jgi:hypothetical protein